MAWYPGKSFVALAESVIDGVTDIVDTAGDVATSAIETGGEIINTRVETIGDVVVSATEVVGATASGIVEKLDSAGLSSAIAGIATGGSSTLLSGLAGLFTGASTADAVEPASTDAGWSGGAMAAAGLAAIGVVVLATSDRNR